MTRISTIGRVGNTSEVQLELNKLVDRANMIYQRLLVIAALRKQVKAKYPQAILPFDAVLRSYVDGYNSLVAEIKAKSSTTTTGVLPVFKPLAEEFGPQGPGIGVIPLVVYACVVGAVALLGAGAYTITEVQRQNKAAETEIKSLDNMLATFKGLPGADAASLGSFISKIDYTPGQTPPPDTGITSTIKTLGYVGLAIAVITQLPKFMGK